MKSFNWHKTAQVQWDERANFWNQSSQEMWDTGSRSEIVPFFEKHVEKGAAVLDIGCGDGYGTYKVNKAGYKATGIDLSEEMIKLANARGEQEGLAFMQGDINALPIEDESFDAAMVINALEWTEHPLIAIEEMKRILKPNGLACIGILGPTAHPRENSYKRLYGETVICNTMMPWEFERLVKENGFAVVDGLGVYKRGVTEKHVGNLSAELKQALTFMWVFMIQKASA
ncbi:class I SAM-dependent methyltransferase [Bacillus sp. 165]|uniref:class I SAM-dependent methyltransferase n=1 Tax=Bacillus sp. 165 TaxID=1529117 RepID=UPI001ADB5213|nr:class I SAM-dependent methyltransferase [Bacillus sp. 165]MBO9129545.1 class I SAM-dependent methyltransferase [Bacillus sp. 165]